MFNVTVNLSDLIDKLNGITGADLVRDIAQKVADEAVVPELAKEPFRATHKKMQFVSGKQRAFVMAGIRSGALQVPYVRTGKIGISEKHTTSNGIDVVVPAEYSDLVRTKGRQARYHEGTWDTTEDIAQKLEADIVEVIGTAAVIDALEKAGLL
jgi:hypothetical protein